MTGVLPHETSLSESDSGIFNAERRDYGGDKSFPRISATRGPTFHHT
jgi:hypothetical protein